MDQRGRNERRDRARREAKSDAGSGEGAASALASLRALERSRNACAPIEQVQPPHPERQRAARKAGNS